MDEGEACALAIAYVRFSTSKTRPPDASRFQSPDLQVRIPCIRVVQRRAARLWRPRLLHDPLLQIVYPVEDHSEAGGRRVEALKRDESAAIG